jgi:hypothetical protein
MTLGGSPNVKRFRKNRLQRHSSTGYHVFLQKKVYFYSPLLLGGVLNVKNRARNVGEVSSIVAPKRLQILNTAIWQQKGLAVYSHLKKKRLKMLPIKKVIAKLKTSIFDARAPNLLRPL